jgi:hypothetical protein
LVIVKLIPSSLHVNPRAPVISLVVITIGGVCAYCFYAVPYGNWYHVSLHVACFAPWTVAWHLSVRSSSRWRLPFVAALAVPLVLALIGEVMQSVVPAIGHTAEVKGFVFSVIGVLIGWVILWIALLVVSTSIGRIASTSRVLDQRSVSEP